MPIPNSKGNLLSHTNKQQFNMLNSLVKFLHLVISKCGKFRGPFFWPTPYIFQKYQYLQNYHNIFHSWLFLSNALHRRDVCEVNECVIVEYSTSGVEYSTFKQLVFIFCQIHYITDMCEVNECVIMEHSTTGVEYSTFWQ